MRRQLQPPSVCTDKNCTTLPLDSLLKRLLLSTAAPPNHLQAVAVEDIVWIRLFNILYRKHKSWMRQQGTPPTWDRDKVRIESKSNLG